MRQRQRARKHWTPADTVDLLAHLDYIVGKRREHGNFSKDIILRLLRSSLEKKCTIAQVEGKLMSICNDAACPQARSNHDKIYRLGTAYLRDLDNETRSKVQQHLVIIKDRAISAILSTPRLRSGSRTIEAESKPHVKREPTPVSGFPPRKRTPRDFDEFPLGRGQAKKEDQAPKGCNQAHNVYIPPRSRALLALHNFAVATSIADSEACTDGANTHDFDAELMGKATQTIDNNIALQNALNSFSADLERKTQVDLDFDDLNLTLQLPNPSLPQDDKEILQDLHLDNIYLRENQSRLERRLQGCLREERRNLAFSTAPGTAGSASMAQTIEIQDERIARLESQLTTQRFLQPFLKLAREDHAPLNLEAIRSDFSKIRDGIKILSTSKDFHFPGQRLGTEELTDLDILLCKNLGSNEQASTHDLMRQIIDFGFPVNTVVQSLIGAAICEWVFDAELRAMAMTSCLLLEGYRHQLSSSCGEVALRNMDFAAHQYLIEQGSFQNMWLPRRASALADRLLKALGPFIRNKGANKQRSRLKDLLESTFVCALNIKTQTLISKDMFETTWPVPQSKFQDSSMDPEPLSSVEDNGACPINAQRVGLTLLPGIRVFSYDRKLVDYCSFAQGGECNLEKPKRISRAVIVLGGYLRGERSPEDIQMG